MYSARASILAKLAADLGVKGAPSTILKALASDRRSQLARDREPLPERSAIFGPEPPDKTDGSAWVDASQLSLARNRSARTGASANAAAVRPTSVSNAAREQLRVLPGPLPSAAAAAATRGPAGRRQR